MSTICCWVTSPRSNSDLEDKYIERSELMFGSPCHWETPRAETRGRLGIDWDSPRGNEYLLGRRMTTGLKGRNHIRKHGAGGGITLEKTASLLGVEGEPRLVRSAGMRRDWSFTDLRNKDGRNKNWDSKSSDS